MPGRSSRPVSSTPERAHSVPPGSQVKVGGVSLGKEVNHDATPTPCPRSFGPLRRVRRRFRRCGSCRLRHHNEYDDVEHPSLVHLVRNVGEQLHSVELLERFGELGDVQFGDKSSNAERDMHPQLDIKLLVS